MPKSFLYLSLAFLILLSGCANPVSLPSSTATLIPSPTETLKPSFTEEPASGSVVVVTENSTGNRDSY